VRQHTCATSLGNFVSRPHDDVHRRDDRILTPVNVGDETALLAGQGGNAGGEGARVGAVALGGRRRVRHRPAVARKVDDDHSVAEFRHALEQFEALESALAGRVNADHRDARTGDLNEDFRVMNCQPCCIVHYKTLSMAIRMVGFISSAHPKVSSRRGKPLLMI